MRIASSLIAVVMLTLAQIGTASAQQAAPAPLAASESESRWQADLAAIDAADAARPQPPGGVLFVGSSSIRQWNGLESQFSGALPVIKRGIGGSRIEEWTRQLSAKMVQRYQPRMVLLYAGENDLAEGRSPKAVLASLKTFVAGVREAVAGTRIAFISIKPSPLRSQLISDQRETNALVRAYAQTEPRIEFIDVFTPMLDAKGKPRSELFLPDGLHLNEAGYALWRSIIAGRLL